MFVVMIMLQTPAEPDTMGEILSERASHSQDLPIVALELDEIAASGVGRRGPTPAAVKDGSFFELLTELEQHPGNNDRHHVVASYQAWIKQAGAASTELFAAWFNVAVELAQLGDEAGAIDAYRNTLSIRPGFGPAISNLSNLLKSAKPGSAGQQWLQSHSQAIAEIHQDPAADPVSEHQKTMSVLHVGCGVASREKLPSVFRQNQWQEIRLDIDPRGQARLRRQHHRHARHFWRDGRCGVFIS